MWGRNLELNLQRLVGVEDFFQVLTRIVEQRNDWHRIVSGEEADLVKGRAADDCAVIKLTKRHRTFVPNIRELYEALSTGLYIEGVHRTDDGSIIMNAAEGIYHVLVKEFDEWEIRRDTDVFISPLGGIVFSDPKHIELMREHTTWQKLEKLFQAALQDEAEVPNFLYTFTSVGPFMKGGTSIHDAFRGYFRLKHKAVSRDINERLSRQWIIPVIPSVHQLDMYMMTKPLSKIQEEWVSLFDS